MTAMSVPKVCVHGKCSDEEKRGTREARSPGTQRVTTTHLAGHIQQVAGPRIISRSRPQAVPGVCPLRITTFRHR